jgi:hypothetical protein
MKLSALAALAVLTAALLLAGCGGGSGSGTEGTHPAPTGSGTAKKATAPNAPTGSKVVSCPAGGEQLRATAVGCGTARATMRDWQGSQSCALGKGDSRRSCSLGDFRCQAVKVDRGAAVSCARAGGDVSFIAKAR